MPRACIIVLDAVGAGALPDAAPKVQAHLDRAQELQAKIEGKSKSATS